MENKTRKIFNKIEKICLAGAFAGLSLSLCQIGIYNYQDKPNITNHKLFITGLLVVGGLSCIGYSLSSRKEKNYYYKK